MTRRSADINVMIKAAEKAAKSLLRDFGEVEKLQISKKGPRDFVSKADIKSEEIIKDTLEYARPDFGFIMEESGVTEGKDKEHTWIVDPLDGTTNFLHGIPYWAISIGLKKGDEIVAGLVYAPAQEELFWAEKGQGAYLDNQRLRVSGREKLEESLLITGLPMKDWVGQDVFLDELPVLMNSAGTIRRFGAAALDMAYVAAGRAEGYWERGPHIWDFAAGSVIIREAGGIVSEIDGGKDYLNNRNVLATNGHIHQDLKNILKSAQKAAS